MSEEDIQASDNQRQQLIEKLKSFQEDIEKGKGDNKAIEKIPNRLPKEEEVIVDKKPIGLSSKIDNLTQKFEELSPINDKKKKRHDRKFELPSNIKRQLKRLAIKNRLLVIYLTQNRAIRPLIKKIEDGFITIDGKPHNCSQDFIYLWKGKFPAVVIPEWDLNPIGTLDYYEAVAQKRVVEPIAIATRMLEAGQNAGKKEISGKAWIFIGLAILAGLYVLFGAG